MEFLVAIFTNKAFVITLLCISMGASIGFCITTLILIAKRQAAINGRTKKPTVRLEDL